MEITDIDLTDALGNPAMIGQGPDSEPVQLKLFAAAKTVIWNMPTDGLTIGDSEIARDVLRGMTTAEQNGGTWAAPDDLHSWVLKNLKTHAPRIFGINAIQVVEAFDQ
jgi:hypothetical protein